jgi:hypothetical protein
MGLQTTLPHKKTHGLGGADALTPADIGVELIQSFGATQSSWLSTDQQRYLSQFLDLTWRTGIDETNWRTPKPVVIKKVIYSYSSGGSVITTSHTGAKLVLVDKSQFNAPGYAPTELVAFNLNSLLSSGVVHTFESPGLNISLPAGNYVLAIQTGSITLGSGNVPTAVRHSVQLYTA